MIGKRTLLGIIPARGGSKGIPRKNIRLVKGKPLIVWTIEQARQSKFLDRVVLSSDDPEIMDIAANCGCEVPFRRPPELAADDTPGIVPVLHAIENLPGYDYVVLLQPTSPLRSVEDIDKCISLCLERGAPACVSVTRCTENPYLMFWRGQSLRLSPLFAEGSRIACRQQLPDVFRINGAVYVALSQWLQEAKSFVTSETIGYEMPVDRSMDIDTEADLRFVDCQGDLEL
jgi:CMP-N,N'-diacetyllegionaminic acid synthase